MNRALRTIGRFWPDYRTVWRWHFYAGVFCIPFVLWLSVTGTIYLFKPQIDALIDRAYDNLPLTTPPAGAVAEVRAALDAVPDSQLLAYEVPAAPNDAARVIVTTHEQAIRVYVHPTTLQVLKKIPEESRFERIIFNLHGQLLMGNPGSILVELAASWTIVMILTGLFLWWPREASGLGGVLYPRLGQGGRRFWRDLHGVVGLWVSALALFLLISGLPWSYVWGNMLKAQRQWASTTTVQQDWPVGAAPEHEAHHAGGHAARHDPQHAMGHEMPMGHAGMSDMSDMSDARFAVPGLAALEHMVATVQPLGLAAPVLISPSSQAGGAWTARSNSQNRMLRDKVTLDPQTGVLLTRENFRDHSLIDRVIGIGVSVHEGQLFGWVNQGLGLLTTTGLTLVSISAVVMWWRRRPDGVLGAPPRLRTTRIPALLIVVLGVLALALPELGISMVLVLMMEKLVLRHRPTARTWLGLEAS